MFPLSIKRLLTAFNHLPGVGPKTAERYVFHLLKRPTEELAEFANALIYLKKNLIYCHNCFNLSEQDPCSFCSNEKRDSSTICIVADPRDIQIIEASQTYFGLYHVLMGNISHLEGIVPEMLKIKELIKRLENDLPKIKEIILALNPNIEGETTSLYLSRLLKNYPIKITRLARGLPNGSDIEYADPQTIKNALAGRQEL